MNTIRDDTLKHVIGRLVDTLLALYREGRSPEQARDAIDAIGREGDGVSLDMVWERESYDGALHVDALATTAEGTFSLAFSPDRKVPWALRGAQRFSDQHLIRVNGEVRLLENVVALLDFVWDDRAIMRRIVDECLVAQAVRQRQIRVSDAELQSGVDDFRRTKRLESAEALREWLAVNGGSLYEVERTIETRLAARKLRDEIVEGRERPYFEAHGADFDEARAVRLGPLDEREASDLRGQLGRERKPLIAEVVRRFGHRSKDRPRAPLVTLLRRSLPAADAEAIFGARPGDLVGPLRSGTSYDLVEVLSISSRGFDDAIEDVKDAMLADWLTDVRRRAEIKWFWGRGSDVPHEP